MKRIVLAVLGLFASSSAFAMDPPPLATSLPSLNVGSNDRVVGCLVVEKESRKWFKKTSTVVTSQCFNGMVSNPNAVLTSETLDPAIKTNLAQSVAYVQSYESISTTTEPSSPPVETVVLTPGVVNHGFSSEVVFKRSESGELKGQLMMEVSQLKRIKSVKIPGEKFFIEVPVVDVSRYDSGFSTSFEGLRFSGYKISLSYKVLAEEVKTSDADVMVTGFAQVL